MPATIKPTVWATLRPGMPPVIVGGATSMKFAASLLAAQLLPIRHIRDAIVSGRVFSPCGMGATFASVHLLGNFVVATQVRHGAAAASHQASGNARRCSAFQPSGPAARPLILLAVLRISSALKWMSS